MANTSGRGATPRSAPQDRKPAAPQAAPKAQPGPWDNWVPTRFEDMTEAEIAESNAFLDAHQTPEDQRPLGLGSSMIFGGRPAAILSSRGGPSPKGGPSGTPPPSSPPPEAPAQAAPASSRDAAQLLVNQLSRPSSKRRKTSGGSPDASSRPTSRPPGASASPSTGSTPPRARPARSPEA